MAAFIVYDGPDGGSTLGVVLADFPEQATKSLGGEYRTEVPDPTGRIQGHFVVLPEVAFVPLPLEDPRYQDDADRILLERICEREPNAPATLSQYQKGDLVLVRPTAFLQKGEGDRTLELEQVPLLS